MTVIEGDMVTEVSVRPATIDPMFDEDHFVCCKVPDDFVGITTTLCGEQMALDDGVEYVDSVPCDECVRISDTDECPLGHNCSEEDDDDLD